MKPGSSINRESIKGNPWISFNFLMLVFAVLAFGSIIIRNRLTIFDNPVAILVILFFAGVIIIRSLLQLYYFEIDKEYLVVRNHLVPWIKTAYKLTAIETATIALVRKQSTQLSIAGAGYKIKSYPAGSLRVKDWQRLFDLLTAHRVPVSRKSF